MTQSSALPWPQLRLSVPKERIEETEQALLHAGALSLTYLDQNDQAVLEPAPGEVRLWDELQLIALFSQQRTPSEISRSVCEILGVRSLPADSFSLLPDQQWERAWMDRFRPMRFGRDLWVCPSHCEPENKSAVNLWLDPGLAFGTGTHATTALCLEWLDRNRPENRTLLDYGCGSGVLAIAALLLGAVTATATDIDPQALESSRNNAELNRVGHSLELLVPEDLTDRRYDILIANILFGPLCELKSRFAEFLPSGATIVMSGILKEQVPEIQENYASHFELDSIGIKDGWARVSGMRY